MSIAYKNISSDYTITVANGNGVFTVNAQDFLVNGNITFAGNSVVDTPFITVAANNTGVINDMGLLARANTTHYAGLRFDTTANAWQVSSSVNADGSPVSPYQTLAAGTANAAGSNTQIQFNNSGAFGASNNLTFNSAANVLRVQGVQVLGNIGNTPVVPSNAVALYNNTIGAGGTGTYVLSNVVNDELVSRTKAILYGIIF